MKPNVFNSLVSSTTALAFVLGVASSQGQVTLYAEYHLGESGSLSGANNLLQDSSVNAKNFTGNISGSAATVDSSALHAPSSTSYLNTSATGNQGWFGDVNLYTTGAVLPTDNFAFGIYVRAASATGGNVAASTIGDVFTLGPYSTNSYKITLETGGWRASSHNVGYIGGAGTFTANTWVHLAVIRSGGRSAFFVNGTQVGGTFATAPVIGQPHIGLNPGNSNGFDGLLDEARIVTFASGETTANIMSVLTNSVVVAPGNNGTWSSTTDGVWSDDTKWLGAVIATDVDRTATFSAASASPIVVALDSNRSIGNMIFSNSNYTIGGSNVLTLSSSTTPGISVDTGLTATLDTTVGGAVGFQKTGPGTLILNASNNSYSGATTISGGTLQIGGAGRLGSGAYSGAISVGTGATLLYSSSAAQTLSGAITGAGGFTKDTGGGTLTLSNTGNNHTGTTTVSAGRILAAAASHLSSGATSIVQSGSGQIYINAGATISNPFNISSIGFAEPSDSQNNFTGAIRSSGSTLSGQITLSGNSRIGALGTTTNTISGKITGAFGIDFYGFASAINQAPVFVLSNPNNDYAGTTTIYNSNFNTANLAGGSTTLRLGASNVIPDGASAGNVAFAINGTNNNAVVALDLNGLNETINGLTVNAGTFATRITNNAAGASVLTIGANDTTSSFSGTVTDAGVGKTLAITKIGTGILTLSGVNSYSGDTTVSDGTLSLASANASNQTSTVTIATGAFLDLAFAGTDAVAKLVIGSTELGVGEYGNSSSVSPVIPLPQITGSGTITVSPAGFSAWQTANSTTQSIDLDHDNDGVSNGVELFLGGTANTTGFTTPLPSVVSNLGVLSVTWAKAATYPATAVYGTDYSVETSETLTGAWTPETVGGGNITLSGNEVKYTFPSPLSTKKFARLKVTGP